MRTVYLCGPMRGYPAFNVDAFMAVEADLIERGWKVYNPARHDMVMGLNPYRYPTGEADNLPLGFIYQAMRWDVQHVAKADAIVCLPGWEQSVGGKLELRVALACGLAIYSVQVGRGVLETLPRAYVEGVVGA